MLPMQQRDTENSFNSSSVPILEKSVGPDAISSDHKLKIS